MGDDTSDREWVVRETRDLRISGNSIVLSMPPKILQEVQFELGDSIELVASRETGEITLRRVEESD